MLAVPSLVLDKSKSRTPLRLVNFFDRGEVAKKTGKCANLMSPLFLLLTKRGTCRCAARVTVIRRTGSARLQIYRQIGWRPRSLELTSLAYIVHDDAP